MKNLTLYLISLYKKTRFLLPVFPGSCRFVPSCSEYTYQAVARYGTIKGLFWGFMRVLRCNPFFKGGNDPVR